MKDKDLKLIYLSEFTARFCTWSILSGLLIHITRTHWVTMPKGLYIMGTSLSLLYMCSILGGFLKDQLFNEKQTIVLGILIIALGNIGLCFSEVFYIGLGLFFIGAGMVTPNTPLLLSALFDNNANSDNKAFTFFYGITNAGIILGPIAGGLFEQYFSWKGIIILNEMMIAGWLVFIFLGHWLNLIKQIPIKNYLKFYFIILFSNIMMYFCLKFQGLSKCILVTTIIGYLVFLAWLINNFKEYKKKIFFALILTVFAIVFFSGEFQITSSLLAYADNFAQLSILKIPLPVSSLVSFESIFVVIASFIITKTVLFSKIRFSQTRVLLGLICCTLAFLILYFSTQAAEYNKISLIWLVFPSLLLGLGEVSLMPSVISYVAKASPKQFKGRLMSGLYFALSISGYLSGLVGQSIMQQHHLTSKDLSFYSFTFITIAIISAFFSFLVSMLRFSSMHSLGALQ